LAAAGDVRTYDDAVLFLLAVKAAGVRVCAASSSKNADGFLRAVSMSAFATAHALRYPFLTASTTLLDLFDADVDGRHVPHGKPDPALFLAAAQALGYAPGSCFVVEDAPAGIEAAKAGGMFAIGVARHDDADSLRSQGADLVTQRLNTIDVDALLRDDARGARQ
jgi:beta-phosphoglucomutase-like phosphatase (HAD superfamily)